MLGQSFIVIIDQIDQRPSQVEPQFRIDYDLEWRRGRISLRQTSCSGSAWLRPNNLKIVTLFHVDLLMPVRLGYVDLVTDRRDFGALNFFCQARAQKKIGMIRIATILTTLIIGLMAGPAVSL